MLPYCVRPPKPASNKHRKPALHPQACGGPIQEAIERDLKELREVYFGKLGTNDQSPFVVFRREYKHLRIGLLHLLRPTRCDTAAYAQLIYASCLNLLRKSFDEQSSNELSRFNFGAFAIFCLYTLYQTAPLRREQHRDRPYSLIPMGYQPEGHHKNPHRRNFHEPIRIDVKHYLLIQRLQEDCLRQINLCKAKGCLGCSVCGMSRDANALIPRLEWQYVQYVGPVGIEGLAGSPDYPFAPTSENKSQRPSAERTLSSSEVLRIDLELCVPHSIDTGFKSELKDYSIAIRDVQRSLSSWDTNKSNQAKRVRSALQPVFHRDDNTAASHHTVHEAGKTVSQLPPSPLDGAKDEGHHATDVECTFRLPQMPEASRGKLEAELRRFVAITGVVSVDTGRVETEPLIGMSIEAAPGPAQEATPPRKRARRTIDTIVDVDEAPKGEPNMQQDKPLDGFLWTGNEEIEKEDDVNDDFSVLSCSSIDEAVSVASGVGRAALSNLLNAASGEKTRGPARKKRETTAGGRQRKASDRFKPAVKRKPSAVEQSKRRSPKQKENDDDTSTATGVGQNALRELLKRAMNHG